MNVSWVRSHLLLSFLIHTGLNKYILVAGCQNSPPPVTSWHSQREKGAFLWQQTQSTLFPSCLETCPYICAQTVILIFTKLVEVFVFKMAGESEVLRALMSQSWRSHFHMSCHLTEVWVQGKISSQPLSMQTFACALQLLSFALKVSSVATPRINNTKSDWEFHFYFHLAVVKI